MSPQRPEPRKSGLSGVHPAIPPTQRTDTTPAMPPFRGRPVLQSSPPGAPVPPASTPRSQKMTINVPAELVDEAKNAFWVDRGAYRSFSSWVAEALQRQIQETMSRHGIQALPQRPGDGLPPGRPLS